MNAYRAFLLRVHFAGAAVLLVAFTVLILFTGCATTRISVTSPAGVRVSASFPKDITADRVELSYDPARGTFLFKATALRADASGVVREQIEGVRAGAAAAPLFLAP